MKVFLTGGTGFVGGHAAEAFLAAGHEVRALARAGSNTALLRSLGPKLAVYEGDLETLPDEALDGVDAVVHAGALTRRKQQSRDDLFRANEEGTRRLLDACLRRAPGLRRFVLVSTIGAIGPSTDGTPLDETRECRPLTDYGWSKLAAERAVLARAAELPVCVVRLPAVYGPRDPNAADLYALPRLGLRPASGRRVGLVHAADAAGALVLATERPQAIGQVFHAAGEVLTVTEFGRALAAAVGRRALPLWLPGPALHAAARLGLPGLDPQKARDLAGDWPVCSRKLRDLLGWTPSRTIGPPF